MSDELKQRGARLSRRRAGGETADPADQADGDAARPVAGLQPGRRLRLRGDRARSGDGGALYRAREHRRGDLERHRRPRARQHRGAGVEAGDGGQGGAVQEVLRHRYVDLEVDETDVDAFVEAVARLEPSFGGINLEDISAPACFEIEKRLKARMKIPVFHDDQHGTAIVTAAGILNGLEVVGKKIGEAKIACNGAGAAAIACLNLLVGFGATKDNILVCDRKGVIHTGGRTSTSTRAPMRRRPTSARWPRRWTGPTSSSGCRRRTR